MHVLVVDDEAPVRRMLRKWVEAEGAVVVEAGSAEEGLAVAAADGALAAALCDLRLPGKDGLWLAEQLRVKHPHTAVVMTTSVHEFDAAVTSLQVGAVDYVAKPFTREQVSEAIQRAFFAHASRRALTDMERELDNRRAQITEAFAELELNASTSLEALLAILQSRDPKADAHARRVARCSVTLALAMGIGEPALSDIERAALVHDIGRLTMPDELLTRAQKLRFDADRVTLCAYSVRGHAILRNVPFLAAATQMSAAVHERYDGSGYPHGLHGDQIPLGARVVGVANAYDELVSGDGHPPVAPSDAVEILSTERHGEFDPLVLEALKKLQPVPQLQR